MDKWLLKIQGSALIDTVQLELDHYTVLAGLNATGKSIIARTFYALVARDINELQRIWGQHPVADKSAFISLETPFTSEPIRYDLSTRLFSPPNYYPSSYSIVTLLVQDYRIVLRHILTMVERLERINQTLRSLELFCSEIESEDRRKECNEGVKQATFTLRGMVYELFQEVESTIEFKAGHRESDYELVKHEFSNVMGRAVEELKDLTRISGEEFKEEDLLPLEITVIPSAIQHLYGEEDRDRLVNFVVEVLDRRFKKLGEKEFMQIPLNVVSSSIAAYISLEKILYAFAQPSKRIVIVIEEPEEALAPPQQFVFSYLLGHLARVVSRNLGKDVRVFATTHSPYIVLGALRSEGRVYYTKFDWRKKRVTIEPRPFAVFALAEKLALKIGKG